jgi:hypothetical protein
MMTQQLQASIVTAPLAQIDRRALSQAWYSALRLARSQAAPTTPAGVRNAAAAESRRALPLPESARVERAIRRAPLPLRAVPKRSPSACPSSERRALPASLAQRIARAFLAPRTLPVRSTLTLGRGEGRVHVVLQSSGECLRLIAICRPADRELVARALAQARLELAGRGYALETKTGAFRCS